MTPPATAQRGGRRRGGARSIELGARHGAPRDGDLVEARTAALDDAAHAAPTGSVRAAAAVQVERPVVRVRERGHPCRNLG